MVEGSMMDDGMIGCPNIQSDFCEQQIFDDNCAVVAETSIINQFLPDVNLDQETAAYISATNGWYQPNAGTSPNVIGNLMDEFGIGNHTNTCATASDLAWELQQGHGVIVGVNSAELWDTGALADLKHELIKKCGLDNSTFMPANHAVTVTGIDVSDPDNPMVTINDSGVGATMSYPLEKFVDAWENSDCFYVATNDPLPTLQDCKESLSHFWGASKYGDAGEPSIWSDIAAVAKPAAVILGGVAGIATGVHMLENTDFARTI